ncbi:MAG: helix-turn-helix transcriptional regulator [Clostridia bacterium]
MNKLYERLAQLCEKKGISAYRMCKDLDLQPAIMTDLKSGRKKSVNANTANKLANYFSVSVNYLLGEDEDPETQELNEYLEQLKNRREMRMLFSLAKGASKEDVEKAVKIIEALTSN